MSDLSDLSDQGPLCISLRFAVLRQMGSHRFLLGFVGGMVALVDVSVCLKCGWKAGDENYGKMAGFHGHGGSPAAGWLGEDSWKFPEKNG